MAQWNVASKTPGLWKQLEGFDEGSAARAARKVWGDEPAAFAESGDAPIGAFGVVRRLAGKPPVRIVTHDLRSRVCK